MSPAPQKLSKDYATVNIIFLVSSVLRYMVGRNNLSIFFCIGRFFAFGSSKGF
jgi:hypothetical protein